MSKRQHNFKIGDEIKFVNQGAIYPGKILDIIETSEGTEFTIEQTNVHHQTIWPGLSRYDIFNSDSFDKIYSLDELKEFWRQQKEAALKFRNSNPVNEEFISENAAWKRDSFVDFCANEAAHLYFTLLNICCLENYFPEIIKHWKDEILNIATRIINRPLPHGDKVAIVSEQMMENYMGSEFEMYVIDSFEAAMKYEISKARKETDESKKQQKLREAKLIEEEILPNLNYYMHISKTRLMNFYSDFLNAVDKNDMCLVDNAIETFLNYNFYEE